MKTVLITGANSYIGTSFEEYVLDHYSDELEVSAVDMVDGSCREKDFSSYDIVFHVAGLAHADVGHVDDATRDKYYAVNRDLAIECCTKAKESGVGQFVFMSSMIVYGDQTYITETTKPKPANFYGDSKWQADEGVRKLASEGFTVTVLRPPMIYGKGSKGNYPKLAKIAKRVPVFPRYNNRRSMLYIENLCEFLVQIMIKGYGGVYWPQNGEYSSTSDVVRYIAEVHGKRVLFLKALNAMVWIAKRFPVKKIRDLSGKACGDSWYEMSMSRYDFEYQRFGLRESVGRAEDDGIGLRAFTVP